jgi:hypothetical protein
MLAWHYTVGRRAQDGRGGFFEILASGYVDVSPEVPEAPIAWFSVDQYWERTVMRGYAIQNKETGEVVHMKHDPTNMFAFGIKPYRIGVALEAVPLNWTSLRKAMSGKSARLLTLRAADWGANPWDWRGSFSPVPQSEWQALQKFTGNEWEAFNLAEALTPESFV